MREKLSIFSPIKPFLSFLSATLLIGLMSSSVQARAYLYQMPDGSRIVTDRPRINTKAKLVSRRKNINLDLIKYDNHEKSSPAAF